MATRSSPSGRCVAGRTRSKIRALCSKSASRRRTVAPVYSHIASAAASARACSCVTVSFTTTSPPTAVVHRNTSERNPPSRRLPPSRCHLRLQMLSRDEASTPGIFPLLSFRPAGAGPGRRRLPIARRRPGRRPALSDRLHRQGARLRGGSDPDPRGAGPKALRRAARRQGHRRPQPHLGQAPCRRSSNACHCLRATLRRKVTSTTAPSPIASARCTATLTGTR